MRYRRPFGVTPREPLHAQSGDSSGVQSTVQSDCYVYKRGDTRRAVLWLVGIFSLSVLGMYCLYLSFPDLPESERQLVRLPKSLEDAKTLGRVLSQYKETYFVQMLLGVFVVYVFLQTFAIPGSIFLSILSGYLFRFPVALLLVCTCSAIGASFCYLLSYLVLRTLLFKHAPNRVANWANEVAKQREHMFNYIVFLRITPLLPNWFINLASPIVGVSLKPFFFGTFAGVLPPSVCAIQGGQTLQKLASTADTVSWRSVTVLALLALLSIAPAVFKNWLRRRMANA